MARDPWWPFYGADFLADTEHLTPAQIGAYVLLLNRLWHQGWLPDDDGALAAIVGHTVSRTTWRNQFRKALLPFFMVHPFHEGLTQKRMAAELHRRGHRYGFIIVNEEVVGVKKKDTASRGAGNSAPRTGGRKAQPVEIIEADPAAQDQVPEKNPENSEKIPENSAETAPHVSNAISILAPLESESESDTPLTLTGKAPSPGSARADKADRAYRMKPGWRPSASAVALARDAGLDVEETFAHFCDHHSAKGSRFVCWDAAFRTWVRNQKTNFGRGRPLAPPRQGGLFPVMAVVSGGKSEPPPAAPLDPSDSWGVKALCAELRRRGARTEMELGVERTVYAKTYIEVLAREVARLAKLPHDWRGDWSLLIQWLDAGIRRPDIVAAVRAVAGFRDFTPNPALGLRRFDSTVRGRKAA